MPSMPFFVVSKEWRFFSASSAVTATHMVHAHHYSGGSLWILGYPANPNFHVQDPFDFSHVLSTGGNV